MSIIDQPKKLIFNIECDRVHFTDGFFLYADIRSTKEGVDLVVFGEWGWDFTLTLKRDGTSEEFDGEDSHHWESDDGMLNGWREVAQAVRARYL